MNGTSDLVDLVDLLPCGGVHYLELASQNQIKEQVCILRFTYRPGLAEVCI